MKMSTTTANARKSKNLKQNADTEATINRTYFFFTQLNDSKHIPTHLQYFSHFHPLRKNSPDLALARSHTIFPIVQVKW